LRSCSISGQEKGGRNERNVHMDPKKRKAWALLKAKSAGKTQSQ